MSEDETREVKVGLVRFAVAGLTLLILVSRGIDASWIAYLGAGLAVLFAGICVRGGMPERARNLCVCMDALAVSLVVWGTGGEGSVLWPLYFVTAAGVAWAPGWAGTVLGAGATVGGYLAVVAASGGGGVALGAWIEAAAILLACGVAAVIAAEMRHLRRQWERADSELAAEISYREKVEGMILRLEPLLGTLSLEDILQWAADSARSLTGADYAHIVLMDGNHHRSSASDRHEAYPSWWHPEVQRLALWSYRENGARRDGANVGTLETLVAVPVADGERRWGALVAGGSAPGVAGERALGLLAERTASVLEKAVDAPGGRDLVSGLPSRASLDRMLEKELSRETAVTVVAVDVSGLLRYEKAYSSAAGENLLWEISRRLSEGSCPAFRCGGGEFAFLLKGGNHARARRLALWARDVVSEATADCDASFTVSTGYTVAAAGDQPEALVEAALLGAKQSRRRDPDGEPVHQPVGGHEDAEFGTERRHSEAALSLVSAAEARSAGLGSHLRAVSHLSGLLGAEMGVSREDLDVVALGGLLHDVGKIGIPDSVLFKQGTLSAEEWQVMKKHPEIGVRMVEKLPELDDVLPMIRHHHEQFDGLGYPDGLPCGETPLSIRVVTVADAFDSMVRERPYRPQLTAEEAMSEILHYSGTQFDPLVAEALERVLEQGGRSVAN